MLVHVWGVAYAAGTLCICVCNSLPDVSWQNQLFSACCMKELQKLEPERSSSYSLPQWAVTGHMGMTHGREVDSLMCSQVAQSLSDLIVCKCIVVSTGFQMCVVSIGFQSYL